MSVLAVFVSVLALSVSLLVVSLSLLALFVSLLAVFESVLAVVSVLGCFCVCFVCTRRTYKTSDLRTLTTHLDKIIGGGKTLFDDVLMEIQKGGTEMN